MQAIFGVEQLACPFAMAHMEHSSLNSKQSGWLLIKSAILCSAEARSLAKGPFKGASLSVSPVKMTEIRLVVESGMIIFVRTFAKCESPRQHNSDRQRYDKKRAPGILKDVSSSQFSCQSTPISRSTRRTVKPVALAHSRTA